ncbi:MAG: sigma-70 family RNA polymerase sigma factor [Oscillospiraceae bacterium]|nr:sigma-70 family RNA polymerase sigma factor [Oscillospiraceae bacterium]
MAYGIKEDAAEIFRQYYDEYYKSLISFACARLRSSSDFSEDCVQEAFMVFYDKLKSGERFEHPRAFLYRTLDNIIKKQQSKISTEQKNTLSLDDPENILELKAEDSADYEKYIKQLENTLDEDERFFYTEKYVNEKKIEQIAEESGLSVGAVTMRLSRLRKKLKKELEDLLI